MSASVLIFTAFPDRGSLTQSKLSLVLEALVSGDLGARGRGNLGQNALFRG